MGLEGSGSLGTTTWVSSRSAEGRATRLRHASSLMNMKLDVVKSTSTRKVPFGRHIRQYDDYRVENRESAFFDTSCWAVPTVAAAESGEGAWGPMRRSPVVRPGRLPSAVPGWLGFLAARRRAIGDPPGRRTGDPGERRVLVAGACRRLERIARMPGARSDGLVDAEEAQRRTRGQRGALCAESGRARIGEGHVGGIRRAARDPAWMPRGSDTIVAKGRAGCTDWPKGRRMLSLEAVFETRRRRNHGSERKARPQRLGSGQLAEDGAAGG